jgi:hypothetical protein
MCHRGVLPSPVAEMQELFAEVSGRLARDAR